MKCAANPLGKFGRDYLKFMDCHSCKNADMCAANVMRAKVEGLKERCKEEKRMSDLMKDIKYVIIEMIENDPAKAVNKSIKTGLFKGLRAHNAANKKENESDVLILLESKEGVLYLLNLEYYNILSLEKSDGSTKITTYFRANQDDQDMAFEAVGEIITGMHAAERTDKNDSNLINLETYSDLPENFGSIRKDVSSSKSSSTIYTPPSKSKPPAAPVKTTTLKDVIEPQFFRRVSKKPSESKLKEMEVRIKEIASGELKVELPIIVGDDEEIVVADCHDYEADCSYIG